MSTDNARRTMDRETLAELNCNLAGLDPNDDAVWEKALREADQEIADRDLEES